MQRADGKLYLVSIVRKSLPNGFQSTVNVLYFVFRAILLYPFRTSSLSIHLISDESNRASVNIIFNSECPFERINISSMINKSRFNSFNRNASFSRAMKGGYMLIVSSSRNIPPEKNIDTRLILYRSEHRAEETACYIERR